ncbi:hypothetical protein C2S53_014974 [Perilla frutescens var. hirtella]|uniref:Uncharacterized protein n=1 Tax=Perilla frutescens var. hirtella TaxID=608512 RepID=A0AAD4NZL3_PERFH|nr:hypothetical protein C2S53_014974 [Perilla frutescens var. hirtella]
MANFHSRSNSFPSQSNPVMDDVQDQLCRLKSSMNPSTSANSISANLASLTDLHQGITNLIQMPSIQQSLSKEEGESWMNELLEESIRLMDLCGFTREVVCLTKESVQDLESSIRRSRGETATSDHINAYMASRKKINKMVKKCLRNFKSSNQNATERDGDLMALLKETESLDFSVLKSVLAILCGEKERSSQRSWSFLSKITQTNRVYSEEDLCSLNINKSEKSMAANDVLKQLNSSEMMIHELEEGVESLFRSLVKTRVSLLNVLSH